ncbi:MAG: helix-turn-helix domain-containing protein [Porticoccaceae bacterium]|nr:helix-turn-helix domain-containing protein [Porticoccaceae bacterium]
MSLDASTWAWSAAVENAQQRLLLLALADRAGEEHTAYPSHERLEQDTCLNLKTIGKHLKRLQELGFIRDTGRRTGPTGRVKIYRLIGVQGREQNRDVSRKKQANGTPPKTESYQKWNDTEFTEQSTQKRVFESPQIWGTESPIESPIEPIRVEHLENEAAPPCEKTQAIRLPTSQGKCFTPSAEQLAQWQGAYPNLDIGNELLRMAAWLDANPKRRKTLNGTPRFVVAWLGRSASRAVPSGSESIDSNDTSWINQMGELI